MKRNTYQSNETHEGRIQKSFQRNEISSPDALHSTRYVASSCSLPILFWVSEKFLKVSEMAVMFKEENDPLSERVRHFSNESGKHKI